MFAPNHTFNRIQMNLVRYKKQKEKQTMETNNTMTVKDVLTDVTKMLSEINVPATMIESIGIPVAKAINGISICIEAMEREQQMAAEREKMAAEQAEPVIELVPEQKENEDA